VSRRRWGCLLPLGLLLGWALMPAWTPPLPAPGVAEIRAVTLGGAPQSVLIRGRDRSNPLVVFLHGGPGVPVPVLEGAMHGPLEDAFTWVHWDQRGAGRSCEVDHSALSIERLMADLLELLDLLEAEFGQREVFVVGASWGTVPGLKLALEHPERVRAYAGEAQLVNTARADRALLDFVRAEAARRGEAEVVAALADARAPFTEVAHAAAVRNNLLRYGGIIQDPWAYLAVAPALALRPEYTLGDRLRYLGCTASSLAALSPQLKAVAFDEGALAPEVPVAFFHGRYDYLTPAPELEAFAARLGSEVTWFEGSAHVPSIEEPDAYQAALRNFLEVH
jgi:pimeloyl-ACP methyl ester carboxylesterase